jgi:PKD repeat protein
MFTLSDTVICPGEDIVFTDASMGKIDAYEWLFGEGASDSIEITGGPHTISYDSGGMKTVQLVVSNDFGSDTSEYTLLVLPAQPEQPLSFIFDDTACFGLQTYTVLDNPLYSGFVWNLSSGGSFNGSTNTNSVQIDWTSAGTHQVSVVAVNACGSSEAQEDTIHILPEAIAGFSYNADGTTVTFTFEGENADSIEWYFGDGNISRDSNPVHSYPDKGDYTAELKVWNECKRDSVSQSFNLQFPVGIAELKQNLSVYPNPASSGETLYFEGTQVNRLTLYSTVGATVLKQELDSNSWFIPNLEDGFYVIEVETQQGRYEMRLLICNQ